MIRFGAVAVAIACVAALLAIPSSGREASEVKSSKPVALQRLPSPPPGLDASGHSLNATAYPIPEGAVIMAPSGSDANEGSGGAPVRTLNRAMDLVPDEGTIVLRAGEYRDWYSRGGGSRVGVVRKNVNLQAYPGETPWISGADVVETERWSRTMDRQRWQVRWETPELCDGAYYSRRLTNQSLKPNTGPCSHADMSDNPSNPMASDPQMVFVDGRPLRQVTDGAPLDRETFSYDWERRWLTIGVDPKGHKVEVSRRPSALLLAGPGRSSIRGIGFRRFASNEYPGPTRAAVVSAAHALTVENTVFTQNAAQGLSVSKPWDGAVVRRSVFADNGYTALGANGGSREGRRTPMLVDQNIFRGNNAERFGERCTISCGAAAAKFAHIRGLTITGNLVSDTRGPAAGLWCDLDCSDTVYSFNIVRGHQKSGIFHEVSDTGLVVGNLLIGNEYGVSVASARTRVYHNTLVDNVQGVRVYDDKRSRGREGWDDVGPDTQAVSVVNNVISGRSYSLKAQGWPVGRGSNPGVSRLFDRVEGNVFHQPTYRPKFASFEYPDGSEVECYSASTAGPCSVGRRDIWLSDVADPLFVDRRLGDYRVRPDSPATGGAASLPADVAEVLGGGPGGAPPSRGALARI